MPQQIAIDTTLGNYSGPFPFIGVHQAENMATVLMMTELLRQQGWNISSEAFHQGIHTARLPLRIEVLERKPLVIVDAAHNCASAAALRKTLEEHYPAARRHLIFATSRDKDAAGILEALAPLFDTITITQYQTNPRACPAEELFELAAKTCSNRCKLIDTPQAAWNQVRGLASGDDLICITGSFFLAAELRELILNRESPAQFNPTGTVPGT